MRKGKKLPIEIVIEDSARYKEDLALDSASQTPLTLRAAYGSHPKIEGAVTFPRAEGLAFEGLSFVDSAVTRGGCEFTTVRFRHCEFKNNPIKSEGTFENCTFRDCPGVAFSTGGMVNATNC